MSAVIVLTPVLITAWPMLTAAVAAAAATTGFHFVDEIEAKPEPQRRRVELDLEGIEVIADSVSRDKEIIIEREGVQVKFSRDFLVSDLMDSRLQEGLLACGWWTLSQKKIQESNADLWVLVLQAFDPKLTQYVLIPPRDLRQRLLKIHSRKNRLH